MLSLVSGVTGITMEKESPEGGESLVMEGNTWRELVVDPPRVDGERGTATASGFPRKVCPL